MTDEEMKVAIDLTKQLEEEELKDFDKSILIKKEIQYLEEEELKDFEKSILIKKEIQYLEKEELKDFEKSNSIS